MPPNLIAVYVLWQIQDILGVFKITKLINGFMRTPKHEALCRVIDWINNYIENSKESKLPVTKDILSIIHPLTKNPLDNSAIDSNAWLAGFIDTDGHFSISLSKRTKKHLDKVIPSMRLEIRQTYHKTSVNETLKKSSSLDNSNLSYYFIMSKIATLWNRKSQWWHQLSNYGDTLKLLILSYKRKFIAGLTNHSLCTIVTTQSIIEKEMGYRVSKSTIFTNIVVKEQRAYGSWYSYLFNEMYLRCALKGFERKYQVKILSNQKRLYTSASRTGARALTTLSPGNINPFFITGFVDGEGCFLITVRKYNKLKVGWRVQPAFQINLHKKDIALLKQIQVFFWCREHLSDRTASNSVHCKINKRFCCNIRPFW